MSYGRDAKWDTLREVLAASIAAAYTAVGTALTHPARIVMFSNSTDKALYISIDGATNILRIPAGTNQEFQITTNEISGEGFFIPQGTQFYVNRTNEGAPTSGAIAIAVMYASPGP